MKVAECMKRNVYSIPLSATVAEAAGRFTAHHIGTLPVVEDDGRLVGILPLGDLLALVMPSFVQLLDDFGFVEDFGLLEDQRPGPEVMARPVSAVMQPPLSVEESCGLLRAFALMRKHDLHDLPIVNKQGQLVGIVSRVDIGTALLSKWRQANVSTGAW
ncbi:MAG: CBS domain-containing protein [Chloroflexota bacterium]